MTLRRRGYVEEKWTKGERAVLTYLARMKAKKWVVLGLYKGRGRTRLYPDTMGSDVEANSVQVGTRVIEALEHKGAISVVSHVAKSLLINPRDEVRLTKLGEKVVGK